MTPALFISAGLAAITLATASMADASRFYVITNNASANSIMGFAKEAGGTYQSIGEFATGGKGTGKLEIPALKFDATHPLANGDDPLISANALAAHGDGSKIVAVTPGSQCVIKFDQRVSNS